MKAPSFDYVRAASRAQVFDLLGRHGKGARLLAGGQTLLATLNMRLSEPDVLIDINALDELRGIAVEGATLRIGTLATHAEIEASTVVAEHAPLLAMAAPHIAHRAIRNRGTFGGSLAYADPAAEWPACTLALDAVLVAASARGERRIAAAEFFSGLYTTALAADELLVACEVPLRVEGERQVFDELARRRGDYAICGLAARALVRERRLRDVRLAFFAVADRPLRATATERLLEGRSLDDLVFDDCTASLAGELEPLADLTSDRATKRHLAGVLLKRALRQLAA